MRSIVVILIGLFALLQYQLWFAAGGVSSAYRLYHNINQQQAVNEQLLERNAVLIADIRDLKRGNQAVEERARDDLGMIKKGEVFYQVVDSNSR